MTSKIDPQELQLVKEFFAKWIDCDHSSILMITAQGIDFGQPGCYHHIDKKALLQTDLPERPSLSLRKKTESNTIQQQILMYAEDVTRQETMKKEKYMEVDETSPWEDQVKSLHEHALGKAQGIRQSFDAYYQLALLLEQRQEMNDFLNPTVKARNEYRNLVGKSSKYTLQVMC